jgi:hypothetical protein
MTDRPRIELRRDSDFRVLIEFVGRIRDTCRNDVVVREKRFSVLMIGDTRTILAGQNRVPKLSAGIVTRDGVPEDLPTEERSLDPECK